MNIEERLVELEIKYGYAEDLLDELNILVYRQQQQIEALTGQVAALRRQAPEAGGPALSLQSELPPHY